LFFWSANGDLRLPPILVDTEESDLVDKDRGKEEKEVS
jgi:hypothetical protein